MINLDKNNANYVVASFASAVKKLNILIANSTKLLLQEVIDEGFPYLVIDLNNIVYIDSSGFNIIISLHHYAKKNNSEMLLCNLSKPNMALVKLAKLNDVLKIYPDKDAAIAAMKLE